MTDIVERLRKHEDDALGLLFMEAADTIERLRGMLENIMAVSGKAERGPSFAEMTKDLPRHHNLAGPQSELTPAST